MCQYQLIFTHFNLLNTVLFFTYYILNDIFHSFGSFGPFGAIIFHTKSSPDGIVFASRPGQRLWKSDNSGVIHETMIFKSALSVPHPTISLLSGEPKDNFSDFQFEHLARFNEKYILISSDSALLLIDPELKAIVASCPKLDPIISVAASNEEIFVLRGLRHIIRISSNPDPYPCEKGIFETGSFPLKYRKTIYEICLLIANCIMHF